MLLLLTFSAQLLSRIWAQCLRRGKLVACCWVPTLGLPGNKSTSAVANSAAVHRELSSDKALGWDVDVHLHDVFYLPGKMNGSRNGARL
jgi:hypothetical protein